jgi:hypothetical protein
VAPTRARFRFDINLVLSLLVAYFVVAYINFVVYNKYWTTPKCNVLKCI